MSVTRTTTTSAGPTLTSVTHVGRLVVRYGLISLLVLIVGRTTITSMVAYWKATHPPPPPPPTVGFGILPPLRFPDNNSASSVTSYTLETPTGKAPVFGDRAKVLLMLRSAPSLLADERAKAFAATYGFVFAPEALGTDMYRWTRTQPLLSTLDLNINTYHFDFTTNFLSRPELVVNASLPSGYEAVTKVKSFLSLTDLLPRDVATVAGEIVYLKSLGGELATAVSESDADYIQVDINRNPIDNQFRMYTPEGYTGIISAILAANLTDKDSIVQLKYNYNTLDYTQVHTYPIRSAQSAWQLLQGGQGFVLQPPASGKAVIRSITMGYYDDFEEQSFLQPIYVFEGDENFLGYIPAVDPQYIQK